MFVRLDVDLQADLVLARVEVVHNLDQVLLSLIARGRVELGVLRDVLHGVTVVPELVGEAGGLEEFGHEVDLLLSGLDDAVAVLLELFDAVDEELVLVLDGHSVLFLEVLAEVLGFGLVGERALGRELAVDAVDVVDAVVAVAGHEAAAEDVGVFDLLFVHGGSEELELLPHAVDTDDPAGAVDHDLGDVVLVEVDRGEEAGLDVEDEVSLLQLLLLLEVVELAGVSKLGVAEVLHDLLDARVDHLEDLQLGVVWSVDVAEGDLLFDVFEDDDVLLVQLEADGRLSEVGFLEGEDDVTGADEQADLLDDLFPVRSEDVVFDLS